jgi:hypothetical protein
MHGDENDKKHQQWAHPLVCGIITVVVVNVCLYYICEYYLVKWGIPRCLDWWCTKYISTLILCYAMFLITGRSMVMGNYALYDLIWTCNVIMFTTAMGLYINNPLVVCASYITILVDQMQWFIDVSCYLIIGKFPIGVAKYIINKSVPKFKKLTCSHHMWFVPLCYYMTRVRM